MFFYIPQGNWTADHTLNQGWKLLSLQGSAYGRQMPCALMLLGVLQALIKHLQGISDEDIPGLYIPIGTPLVYELDENLHAIKHREVADDSNSED